MPELNGSPDFAYCIYTSFPLTIRSNNPIGGIEPIRIQSSALICPTDSFIRKCPHKATGEKRMRSVVYPKIFQSGSMSLIVLTMHKFGRHKDIIAISKTGYAGEIRRIVMCIQPVKISPGMNYMPLLRIIIREMLIKSRIPASFVPITPKYNRRMIYVTDNHLPL